MHGRITREDFLEAERLLAEERALKAPPKPKMVIEWFGEAADSALSDPVNQLVEGLLDEGGLSVIYGDSGSGKTFAALDLAFHVWRRARLEREKG